MQAAISTVKRRNVILMGICFMLMFTAYNPTHNYALALLGNHAYFILAIIHLVMALANFFASAALKKLGSLKLAMATSGYAYTAYLLAISVYLASSNAIFLVYIFSVVIGIGAGILWAAQGSCLTENSDPNARGASSGLFFSIMSVSNISGNMISFVMFYFGFEPVILFIIFALTCAVGCSGLLFIKRVDDQQEPLPNIDDTDSILKKKEQEKDITNTTTDVKSDVLEEIDQSDSAEISAQNNAPNNAIELEDEVESNDRSEVIDIDEKKSPQVEESVDMWQEIWKSISMLARKDLVVQMGIFFFSSQYSTYINGPFTSFFNDNRMQVGGIFTVNGVGKVLFAYLGGKLKDRLSSQGYLKVMTGVMAVLISICFVLQFMKTEILNADPTTRFAIFYVIGFFASADAALNIYVYAYLGKLYPKNPLSIQAISAFKFVQSMSRAMAFFYGRFLNGMVQVIIMLVILGATFPVAIKFNKDKRSVSCDFGQFYLIMTQLPLYITERKDLGSATITFELSKKTEDLKISLNEKPRKTSLQTLSKFLEYNDCQLKKLDLHYAKLENEDLRTLLNSFQRNTSLTSIVLSKNQFDKKGRPIADLINILEKCPMLVDIDLHLNDLDADHEGAIKIAEFIKKNSHLQSLNLKDCCFTEEGCELIVKSLEQQTSLTQLDLSASSNKWINMRFNHGNPRQLERIQRLTQRNLEALTAVRLRPINEFAFRVPGRKIPFVEISEIVKIKEGSYGEIYLAKWQHQKCALKKFKNISTDVKKQILQEIDVLLTVRHNRIVLGYGTTEDPATNEMMLVLEYMEDGSLEDLISTVSLSRSATIKLAKDVAEGVIHLHRCSPMIIHRDIKSANVLLCENKTRAKLSDFGTSKYLNEKSLASTNTGSFGFMAPEILEEKDYNEKADVYSFGALLYQMMTSNALGVLFNENERVSRIEEKVTDLPLQKLIIECCRTDPKARPTMDECLNVLNEEEKTIAH